MRRQGAADDATDDSPDDAAGTIAVMVMVVVVMVMVMILDELNFLRRSNLGKPRIIGFQQFDGARNGFKKVSVICRGGRVDGARRGGVSCAHGRQSSRGAE